MSSKSILEMSDEELANLSAPPASAAEESAATADPDADGEAGSEAGDSPAAAAADAEVPEQGEQGEQEEQAAAPAEATASTEQTPAAQTAEQQAADAAAVEQAAIDYKAEYERVLGPIKANGREIKVNSVDDAISLMQMGANYNKRMAALKPNLKLLKMLENNGLLNEEKLSFLIDVSRKDPGAINKLVHESGIDPMEIDADKAQAYKRSSHAVADTEVELDLVLDELKGSESYTQTLDVVGNVWDDQSRRIVSQNPQLIRVLHDHMASGIYTQISNEVERERMLGRLNGVSDIEAYRQVGDAIHARGGFAHQTPQPGESGKAPASAPAAIPVQSAPASASDSARNAQRRAASGSTPTAPASTAAKDFNPLSMSDEEISRMAAPKFS